MSLQYIIDGYNITNHPSFLKQIPKRSPDTRVALIQLIRFKKLCGSKNNSSCIVFDGYPGDAPVNLEEGAIKIVFSRGMSADERIKKMLELIPQPKNVIVVSDDKEIRFFAAACGAKTQGVKDFIKPEDNLTRSKEEPEPEISYAQMHKINEELKKIWLS